MANIRELLDQRAQLVAQARAINDKAGVEKRDLLSDEQTQWDAIFADVAKVERQIDREQKLLGMSAGDEGGGLHQRMGTNGEGGGSSDEKKKYETFVRGFNAAFRPELRATYRAEFRALQQDIDTAGGYLVPPVQWVNQLIKAVDDQTFIRQWATVWPVANADSLGVPTLEADPADADWTSELGTGSLDSTMSFGKRELKPKPLGKRIKVSRKLLRSVPDASALVQNRLAYKFGISFEKACMTGAGATGPLGVFTASNDGIPTSRDVSTGNAATTPTFDGLIEAKYTLKGNYWPFARWCFHRDVVKAVAKLKDGNGDYIWRESVRVGEPDRILGFPVGMSEYSPNTMTTGQYVGVLGDFRQYWIADALTLEIQQLNELYAEDNQVGLIGRLESDGAPVLAEAFVRVKLG